MTTSPSQEVKPIRIIFLFLKSMMRLYEIFCIVQRTDRLFLFSPSSCTFSTLACKTLETKSVICTIRVVSQEIVEFLRADGGELTVEPTVEPGCSHRGYVGFAIADRGL